MHSDTFRCSISRELITGVVCVNYIVSRISCRTRNTFTLYCIVYCFVDTAHYPTERTVGSYHVPTRSLNTNFSYIYISIPRHDSLLRARFSCPQVRWASLRRFVSRFHSIRVYYIRDYGRHRYCTSGVICILLSNDIKSWARIGWEMTCVVAYILFRQIRLFLFKLFICF